MSAQTVGQWAGLVIITAIVGALGAGVIRLVEAVGIYYRSRRKFDESAEAIRIVGPQLERFEHERQKARALYARAELTGDIAAWVSRRGGKEEAARIIADHFATHGGRVYIARPVPSFREAQASNWRKHPGDFIIGERLRLEANIIDGDPSFPGEPRGILG